MDRYTQLLDRLVLLRREGRITRRQFARLTGGGVGVAALSAFLAACGSTPPEPTAPGGSTGGSTPATPGTTPAASSPATTPAVEGDAVKTGGTLIFGADTAPVGYDPHLAIALSSQMLYEQVYDTLFQFTPSLEIVPALAESLEVIDEQTYRMTLRQGVTFHEGQPFTAADVRFSFERMLDPDLKTTRRPWFESVEGIETPDDYTVVFHLNKPFAPLISYMAMPASAIVSESFTLEHGNDLTAIANGTGPFVLERYETNQFARLTRFADHWREGLPYLDGLEMRIMPDEASRLAAMRAGEIDMTRLFEQQNAAVLANEDVQMIKGLVTARALTFFNCRKPPFDDVRVRQAIAYAIDRQAFIDTALLGEGVQSGPIPPAAEAWALPVSEFQTYRQDIARAKQLLADAGYGDGFTATLTVSSQYPFDVANAQVLQDQLKQIGVTLEIQQLEWGNLLDVVNNTRNFELLNIMYVHQPDPDGYTYTDFHSQSPINVPGIADAHLDDLLERGRATADPAARKPIYDEVQRLLADELVPLLVYYCYYQYLPAQPYVRGFQPIPSLSRVYLRETWLDR